MIKLIKRSFYAGCLVLLGLAIWLGWWLFSTEKIYPSSIMVETGEPFYKVVVELKDRDIINSPWFFSKFGILIGLDRKIIPGRYDFDGRISNFRIIRKLWRGDIAILAVTIPEGYNLKAIGRALNQKCGANLNVFDSLVRDSGYLAGLGIDAGFAEGYLFPETYNFRWGISSDEAIRAMVAVLFSRLDDSLKARCDSMGYSVHDMLTMASIVEAETSASDEYGKVASVYYNRLRIGMKLQADPTVIYAMGGLDRQLLVKDYQFPSSFNTYLHAGLPPGPICSPGLEAIHATLYPDSTDYLYFVADGRGRHIFNTSYKQHLIDNRRIKGELKRQSR